MSFLTRTTPMLRTVARTSFAPRAFSTSLVMKKSPTETVKDTVKGVDRAVSDKLVDGIEIGQTAAEKAKQATGISKGKAEELAGEAKGKAAELKGEAKGKAAEVKGKM